jgi:cytochrome c5
MFFEPQNARTSHRLAVALLLSGAALLGLPHGAAAQPAERTGHQVVEAVCSKCHATGAHGAPRIGDRQAWSQRASQGLTSLTEHALNGIREMPAHGGNPQLSDLEIARAVTYMVNQSGGHWVEPVSARDLMAERSGREVVEAQCAKCHGAGIGGAPKIGDRKAWRPRLKHGVDALVRSAIRGHGGMPPRGDKADLTDAELRNAILYMYNPTAPAKSAPAAKAAPPPPGMHKVVGPYDVYLGFVSAATLRKYPPDSIERRMHGGVPSDADAYHANVTVLERRSRTPVADAAVELQIEQPGMTSVSKPLEAQVINKIASYGAYVKLNKRTDYVMTVRVRGAGDLSPVEARFPYRQY